MVFEFSLMQHEDKLRWFFINFLLCNGYILFRCVLRND